MKPISLKLLLPYTRPIVAVGILLLLGIAAFHIHRSAFRYGGLNLDLIAYRYQFETLARGRLQNPLPPCGSAFAEWEVVQDGEKAYSKYFPGHTILLLGAYVAFQGDLSFQVFLLAIFGAMATAAVARQLGGGRAALWALLLLCISPFYLATSGLALSYGSQFLLHATAIYALFRSRRSPGRRSALIWALAAGCAAGWALATRPLSSLALILPSLLLLGFDLLKGVRFSLGRFLLGGVPVILAVGGCLAYNSYLTGDLFTTPYAVYWPLDRLGFGPFRGQGAVVGQWEGVWIKAHTLKNALGIFWGNITQFDRWFLGFRGSGIFAACVVVAGLWKWKPDVEKTFLLAVGIFQPFLYGLHWFPGFNHTGPIYYFEVLVPVVILLAWSLSRTVRGPIRITLASGICILAVISGLQSCLRPVLLPMQVRTRLQQRDLDRVRATVTAPALVFVPGFRLGELLASLVNGPDPLEQRITFALDRPKTNAAVAALMPDREVWQVVRLPGPPRPMGWRLHFVKLRERLSVAPPKQIRPSGDFSSESDDCRAPTRLFDAGATKKEQSLSEDLKQPSPAP